MTILKGKLKEMAARKEALKELKKILNRACKNICRISRKVAEGDLRMSDSIKRYLKTWEGIRAKTEEEIINT